MKNTLINLIRPYGRLLKGLFGFLYDIKRYIAYGGWRSDMKNMNQRNYHSVKVYHSLEKSMSFKNQKEGSGWRDVNTLLELLKIAKKSGNVGYHDKAAKSLLSLFIEQKLETEPNKAEKAKLELSQYDFGSSDDHGIKSFSNIDFDKGKLDSPESFFFSRFSLREFKNEIISEDIVRRAVALAMKSPSVCNRQEWHVYHATDQEIKNNILKYQQGNRGFGDRVPNLFIVTIDLNAFMPGQEHYQHWIDGGLFSMSLIYALHSLGIASCCLNWSQAPKNDKLFRSIVPIKSNHTVMMMIAAGYPDTDNNVCLSTRRPLDEVYTKL